MLNLRGFSWPLLSANAAGGVRFRSSASANEQQDSVRRCGEESSVAVTGDNSSGVSDGAGWAGPGRAGKSPGSLGRLSREQARSWRSRRAFRRPGWWPCPCGRGARCGSISRVGCHGPRGTMGYLKRTSEDGQLLRERAGHSLSLGALGAGLLCQLCFSRAPLSTEGQSRGAAGRLDCAVCVEQPYE